mgnify:CR=1 FL=1
MSKKHIIRINGKPVEVSEEIYTYIMRSDWNNYYAEIKRKRERIRINSKKKTVKIIPSREDSLDRLMAIGTEFANDSEPIAEAAIRKITVQKALEQLTADERFIIVRIYFEGNTERELAKEMHLSQSTINSRKQKILLKLRKIIEK